LLSDYERDGAAVVRGIVDPQTIGRMRIAVDRVMANPADTAAEYTPENSEGRFFGDFFIWLKDPYFAEFIHDAKLTRLAAAAMRSKEVYFFYDHLLVKEPKTGESTPLHQDLPYWPLSGRQILSLWIPLDPVSGASGAVQYIAGSHKWNKMYAPREFSDASGFSEQYAAMGMEPAPSLESISTEHRSISWDTQPGDVIIHHPLTLHFANGNSTASQRRRAIALRYVGDDARYAKRPGNFIQHPKLRHVVDAIDLAEGDLFRGALFPRVFPPAAKAAKAPNYTKIANNRPEPGDVK
jgi:ectoine hydroxylase-related dioxygenase (phytanoyl-CoA dioxygenase family)